MTTSGRAWWRNCDVVPDSETLAIDRLEDRIAPIETNIAEVRELISRLELCHHKAERWVENIIEAIGAGETKKAPGIRTFGQQHPNEKVWRAACAALTAWCAGCSSTKVELSINTVPASQLLACLGERSPLKEWQVQRVIDKIRSVVGESESRDAPTAQYVWLLLSGGENECAYRNECPEYYKEHEDFWLKTVRTIIHDTVNGDEVDLSLGFAIDMLWPCHWRFVENLQVVLEVIGGRLKPGKAFAACAWNLSLLPMQRRMEVVSSSLKSFCGEPEPGQEIDEDLLALMGKPTEEKRWLAASLDKTIRLQLPGDRGALYSLAAPDWTRQ